MTIYKITAISGAPKSAAKHVGKSVRIISLKAGEPCVMNYVDDPTWTIWTPEVVNASVEALGSEVQFPGELTARFVSHGRKVEIDCGEITYTLQVIYERTRINDE